MANETRVNLKRLLEDIRDAYNSPLAEVILVELIANALDSGASRCDIIVDNDSRSLRFVDNGQGMKRAALKEYHNIAASTKTRGQGIGFAGIGAKLSLLVAETVTTESKGGRGSKAATEWRLVGPYRAPWKFVPSADSVPYARGTAVTMKFSGADSDLLDAKFVHRTIIRHFYPLLHDRLREEILRLVYRKGVEFTVNGELVVLPEAKQRADYVFQVRLGKSKRPIGAGFLSKNILASNWLTKLTGSPEQWHNLANGLSVSTYGKVIKSGWEWLGLAPKSAEGLCGLVEVPALSELLTTNKSDFLSDAFHLRKYYRLRRAIQEAVIPALRSLGAYGGDEVRKPIEKNIKPLAREIEAALEAVAADFPEIAPLLASHRKTGEPTQRYESDRQHQSVLAGEKEEREGLGTLKEGRAQEKNKNKNGDRDGTGTKKRPGLSLLLTELADEPTTLGCVREETVMVNTLHPAWKKALATKQKEYHIVLATALALSEYLDPEKNPQRFLERLLFSWSELGQQTTLL